MLRISLFSVMLIVWLVMVSGEYEEAGTNRPFRDGPDEQVTIFEHASAEAKFRAVLRIFADDDCSGDTRLCNVSCSQGKVVVKKSGCCKCTCRIGYSLNADGVRCDEAHWTSWSSWSTCISSGWGGLQHRERTCKSQQVTTNGRCIGKGSEGRTCSSITEGFRIRKNIRNLTNEELHDLLQAFTKFKADNSTDGFMYTAKYHGWPNECPWYKMYANHSDGHCSWHEHPMFLTWHRLITVQFELGLNKYLRNKYLGIPYWDWNEDGWDKLPHLVSKPHIFDPILQRYVKNPFHTTFIPDHALYKNKTLRTYRFPDMRGISWNKLLLRSVIRAMNLPTYEAMDMILSKPHNQIHNCMCAGKQHEDDCLYSMIMTDFAAFDPLFLLHHSQIDRLYILYKDVHDAVGDTDWTNVSFVDAYYEAGRNMTTDIVNSFDFPQSPFCNSSMNTNPVTLNEGVWTVRNAFYGEQLFGYVYDSLDLGGHNWRGLVADIEAKKASHHFGSKLPFVSFAAPDLGTISNKNTDYIYGCTTSESLLSA